MIFLSTKPQKQAWCYSFICIWRPTKGYYHSTHQKPFPLELTWGYWRQTCASEPNTLTSDFQWCGCALPSNYGSTMKMLVRLQYGAIPHIRPYTHGMRYSYPLGSPMLCSYTSILWGLQPPLLSLCNTLFRYAPWWTNTAPLLPYCRTYSRKYPGIGHSDLPLHSLDMIIPAITMAIIFLTCAKE